ncbi:BCCT family transporter, partial [Pseudomonas aeruginosa]|uniref:BCCT family transporter n=1 Tax=Pseudomonas aeruginosa TaxID=287 RepID=UPI0019695D76
IFYWGWWISWAPFVGMFIAKISKGRTVGQVNKGAFLAPILFSFVFLSTFGSLGIKMQRAAELALDVTVDKSDWSINCADAGYT